MHTKDEITRIIFRIKRRMDIVNDVMRNTCPSLVDDYLSRKVLMCIH